MANFNDPNNKISDKTMQGIAKGFGEKPKPLIRKAGFFSNAGEGEKYPGYHNPEYKWNGFSAPYFEKETADKIANHFSSQPYGGKTTYEQDKDRYHYVNENSDEDEYFEGEDIDTENGKKHVYSLFGSNPSWVHHENNNEDDLWLKDLEEDKNITVDYDDNKVESFYPSHFEPKYSKLESMDDDIVLRPTNKEGVYYMISNFGDGFVTKDKLKEYFQKTFDYNMNERNKDK